MRQIVALFVLCVGFGLAPGGKASAAELVMFRSPSCTWCEAWDREIGGIYGLTDEARVAPLRRVNVHDPLPGDLAGISAVVFTPTFVLIEDGEEVGRILGYPGEDFFWGLLNIEMQKLSGRDRFAKQDGALKEKAEAECPKNIC